MSLKQLVNNPEIYNAFLEHLDKMIETNTTTLVQAIDPVMIHRTQGAIMAFNRLKKLREAVNEHP